ncbi:TATA box-binding protein-associated factor RNA polymerase I subunit B isoform X2 [Anopheles sinensis]|uniref:TATA box-binding protein-associated factor RNA polymerase I subunit B isoform X2 n=1 Tax=Anopheles sinensis TaxID=74873 RepID=A0A084VJ53_ANOSI|nr:TATA box-binding protein-associated factor RNA polymerase I subunit B isoform X2 [Anopheles sinensis]
MMRLQTSSIVCVYYLMSMFRTRNRDPLLYGVMIVLTGYARIDSLPFDEIGECVAKTLRDGCLMLRTCIVLIIVSFMTNTRHRWSVSCHPALVISGNLLIARGSVIRFRTLYLTITPLARQTWKFRKSSPRDFKMYLLLQHLTRHLLPMP